MGVWLTGIVILLIVGILLDGWRRMRQGRKDNLKMPSYQSELAQPDDDYTSELPNGGARVVAHRRTEPKIGTEDRKSTRLNSSHVAISYAVFCLKKINSTPGQSHEGSRRVEH